MKMKKENSVIENQNRHSLQNFSYIIFSLKKDFSMQLSLQGYNVFKFLPKSVETFIFDIKYEISDYLKALKKEQKKKKGGKAK